MAFFTATSLSAPPSPVRMDSVPGVRATRRSASFSMAAVAPPPPTLPPAPNIITTTTTTTACTRMIVSGSCNVQIVRADIITSDRPLRLAMDNNTLVAHVDTSRYFGQQQQQQQQQQVYILSTATPLCLSEIQVRDEASLRIKDDSAALDGNSSALVVSVERGAIVLPAVSIRALDLRVQASGRVSSNARTTCNSLRLSLLGENSHVAGMLVLHALEYHQNNSECSASIEVTEHTNVCSNASTSASGINRLHLLGSYKSAPSSSPPPPPQTECRTTPPRRSSLQGALCAICLEPAVAVAFECGHPVVCAVHMADSNIIDAVNRQCPICQNRMLRISTMPFDTEPAAASALSLLLRPVHMYTIAFGTTVSMASSDSTTAATMAL